MALKESKKAEWEKTLKELNLMNEEDCIEEHTAGDYWHFGTQTRGNYFFTKEKFIFVSGFGVNNFSMKYTDIKEIKKSMVSLFMPTGITVTADNPEDGKTVKYKCSVMKRQKWIELLSDRSGVSC